MSEIKENIDVVVGYTKQFIEAVTPAAKQAYEIGLTTLRIDAAAALLAGVLGLLVALFCVWLIVKKFVPRLMASRYNEEGWVAAITFTGVAGIGGAFIALFTLANVWVWTKLFAPELWLVHQAIEKLVK